MAKIRSTSGLKMSRILDTLSPSETLKISSQAKDMIRKGIPVISLSAGEPDFDTPEPIKDAAKQALDNGFTKYTPSSGIGELKQAIIDKFKRDNDLNYVPQEIIVSCGAKHCIFNAIQVLTDPGNEVMVPHPYWVSYKEQIKFSISSMKVIPTRRENDFKLDARDLEKNMSRSVRALILNSPCNPTGAVYSKDELQQIADFAVRNEIWVISDEIYEKMVYNGNKHISIAQLGGDIKDQTIVINGLSKAYAMTGWRIGYAAGSREVIGQMSTLQAHTTSNPCSIAQKAAVVALNQCAAHVGRMSNAFAKRRTIIMQGLDSIPGISYIEPQGAFYIFADMSGVYGKSHNGKIIANSRDLCLYLLDYAHVALIPGSAFGEDNFVRISYAASENNITEAINRIDKALKRLT